MSSLPWNHCPASAGISVQLAPEFAIRLIVADPCAVAAWKYVALRAGEIIAASDGDAAFNDPFAALVACVDEVDAELGRRAVSYGE